MRTVGLNIDLVLACALFLTGCSTVMQLEPQLVSKRFPFLQDGKTAKEEVLRRLGEPYRRYEGGRILTYQMCGNTDQKGWEGFSDARPMDTESEARRAAGRCWPASPNTLILVFGPGNLVERRSLVVVE
jgi:hypothetical protein